MSRREGAPMFGMRRREFITLLGGTAVAWPLAARAQQPERMRRIGVLSAATEIDPNDGRLLAVFRQALQKLGWIDGRTVLIDTRWTAGDPDRARKYAAELVALTPDVILAGGGSVVGLLLREIRSVPIVFTLTPDPVGAGFVESLARPGGNATGFTLFEYSMGGKWLELLKEIAPGIRASGRRSRSRPTSRDWFVRRNPIGGLVVRSGINSSKCARR